MLSLRPKITKENRGCGIFYHGRAWLKIFAKNAIIQTILDLNPMVDNRKYTVFPMSSFFRDFVSFNLGQFEFVPKLRKINIRFPSAPFGSLRLPLSKWSCNFTRINHLCKPTKTMPMVVLSKEKKYLHFDITIHSCFKIENCIIAFPMNAIINLLIWFSFSFTFINLVLLLIYIFVVLNYPLRNYKTIHILQSSSIKSWLCKRILFHIIPL